jgi:hypothetical protein
MRQNKSETAPMPHKLTVTRKDGTLFRDSQERVGPTPHAGDHLILRLADGEIACQVEQVLPGGCTHPTKSFEAVDDVRAREQ